MPIISKDNFIAICVHNLLVLDEVKTDAIAIRALVDNDWHAYGAITPHCLADEAEINNLLYFIAQYKQSDLADAEILLSLVPAYRDQVATTLLQIAKKELLVCHH